MHVTFTATQSIELPVPDQPIPIQHYLRQPQRLVQALVDPSRIEPLTDEHFRLKMRPIHFMAFNIQPTVDMRIWAEAGMIRLQSTACEIRGIDYINQRFKLNLTGYLAPKTPAAPQTAEMSPSIASPMAASTVIVGQADLQVQVELPPALWLTPKSLMETTGNGLLRSVLLTVKQRLAHQLLADYRAWVTAQQSPTAQAPRIEASPAPEGI